MGIVTKHRGISIHKATCRSIEKFTDEERKISLFWDTTGGERYEVELRVLAEDRERLLADCSIQISAAGTNIVGCTTVTGKDDQLAQLGFTLEVNDINHLNSIINRLIDTEGVRAVTRRRRSKSGTG